MENMQISPNSHSEYNERQGELAPPLEAQQYTPSSDRDQVMLEYLINTGFLWEEAKMLLHLREHLYENAEMCQRITDDLRMHFARWLYINGEMDEG